MGDQIYNPMTGIGIQGRPLSPGNAVDAAEQDIVADKAREQGLLDMALNYKQRQAELQRYQGMTPLELSVRGLDAATADAKRNSPAFIQSEVQGGIGRNQSLQAQGQYDMGTVGSRTALGNEQNNYQAIGTAIQRLQTQLAGVPGVLGRETAYQQFLTTLPPEIRQNMPRNYEPNSVRAMADQLVNTPAHRQKLGEIDRQSDRDIKKYKQIGVNQTAQEEERTNRAIEVAWIRAGVADKNTRNKIESVVTQYLQKYFNGQPTTPQEDKAFEMAQRIMYQVHAAAQYGMSDPNNFRAQFIGMPPQPPRAIPEPVMPNTAAPDPRMKAAVEAAGQKYDPQRYEYRMSPDGKVQFRERK